MSLCVAAFDSHWPKTDPTTLNAMFEFLARNRVAHFVFGGDQFDNEEISHHNKGKIAVEASGELAEHTESFEEQFLKPLNKLLRPDCQRIWIQGNHDHWEEQFAEEHPQVRKLVIRKPKDWKWVGLGEMHRIGKIGFIHGEGLSGRYHAQQAVDRYCTNVAYGHFHTIQSAIKILPHAAEQRWMAQSFPAMCQLNPTYLRNKPTCWVNGFGIFEIFEKGYFNMYPIVVNRGKFSWGGKTYKG